MYLLPNKLREELKTSAGFELGSAEYTASPLTTRPPQDFVVTNKYLSWVAAIAPWFHLRLPSCGPRFESQAHHLSLFQFVLLKLYRENIENKQKEAGIGPFLTDT